MTTVLDVAIGLAALYLLLSILATTLQELTASALSWRARDLYSAIEDMLQERLDPKASGSHEAKSATAGSPQQELVEKFYRHPLVRNLAKEDLLLKNGKPTWGGNGIPSYIPAEMFALALIDILQGEKTVGRIIGADQLLLGAESVVSELPEGELRRTLLLLVGRAQASTEQLDRQATAVSRRIESWFNARMARASGWYKRKMQIFSLVVAGVLAIAFNVDTVNVASTLWNSGALRERIVVAADAYAKSHQPPGGPVEPEPKQSKQLVDSAISQSNDLLGVGYPLGWKGFSARKTPYFLVGWLLTAFAVSLGSGFWFGVLSKTLQLRGTGAKVSAVTGRAES